jgi:hypothetical protein
VRCVVWCALVDVRCVRVPRVTALCRGGLAVAAPLLWCRYNHV